MKHVRKIDESGFFIADIIIDEGNTVPRDCIEVNCPNGFYKPKWNGIEWVEGATQQEIDAITNVIVVKTEIEILKEKISIQDGAIIELAEIISNLGGV